MSDLPQHDVLAALAGSRDRLTRFMMCYRFAIQVVETKISILQQEFQQAHRYNPIEHVTSRLKRPEAVIAKARRRGIAPDEEAIRAGILDIAGVRVVCSFGGDVYRMQQTLCAQADVEVLELKDYVARPKPSGYRSLHAIISVPVYLSDETVRVPLEVQFRTISQDFWASLEHKIFYKYEHEIPGHLVAELQEAAASADLLDQQMERLAVEIQTLRSAPDESGQISEEAARAFLDLLAMWRAEHPDGPG